MRNYNMDVTRGIAVLGLVYMNAYYFGLFDYGYVPLANPPLSDAIIQLINSVFFDGRFRSLFCLLFGAGLAIQWQRAATKETIKRRLSIIAIFGLLHGFLFWAGDILLIYACAGWFVASQLEQPNSVLLKRALYCYGFTAVITIFFSMIEPLTLLNRDSTEFITRYNELANSILNRQLNNALMFAVMLLALPLITMWMAAAIMLVGVVCYRSGVFNTGFSAKQMQYIVLLALFFTLMRLGLDSLNSDLALALIEPVNWLAALFCAAIYCQGVVKLCNNSANKYPWLQQTGRLALTLYLMQTVCLLLIFAVLQPAWIMSFNRLDYFILATAILALQLLLAAVYFKFFQQGPFEFLLRKLC